MGWTSTCIHAANEPNLIGELEGVSHEEYGLVADRVHRGWARAVYGYTRTGQVRRGWVQLMPGRAEYKPYDEQLLEHITWFEEPERVELFDRPNGHRIRFPLGRAPDGASDHELNVLSIRSARAIGTAMLPRARAAQTVLSRSYTPSRSRRWVSASRRFNAAYSRATSG